MMSRLPSSVAKLIPVVTVLVLVCVGLGLFASGRPNEECLRYETRRTPVVAPGESSAGVRQLVPYRLEEVCAEERVNLAPFNEASAMWWFFGAGALVLIGLSLVPVLAGRTRTV